jgi:hypothetical protein
MSQESMSTTASSSTPAVNTKDTFEAKLKIFDRILATITAIGVIVGGVWGLYNHFGLQHEANQLWQNEIDLMVFKEKKETYLALIDAAGEIIACKNRQEVSEKAPLFLKLYLGRAHVIADADSEVRDKKIAFKEKLDTYLKDKINESPFKYFGSAALALTNACKVYVDPNTLMK